MSRVMVIGATGHEALAWLVANGQADVGGQPFPAPSAQ
jgi:hypothetical protein